MSVIDITVECAQGKTAGHTPHSFKIGNIAFPIQELIDSWISTDHHYFKVRAHDGTYILRHDLERSFWEITLFEHAQPNTIL